ncbi:acyl carrier protein [Algibacter pectinivorans]|uniref:Acyl carrier protein n=1 Tax=Algibacter pectinivorans TaxID=870482 RepID=A0A1I1PP02_9FLAO|nr:acyl carrier protein [Algibacter pectinivorans]SFD07710.1 acyl carrier protein [Algibacter pectinivorans]
MQEYLDELNLLFREVFENEDITLTPETVASDIDEWDSINHIYLVVEIEKHFNIKFTSSQILEWKNVGEIVNSIQEKR